jgi:hypothetical protein
VNSEIIILPETVLKSLLDETVAVCCAMEDNPHKTRHIHKNLRIVWFEIGLYQVDDATNMLEVASSTDIFLQFEQHFFKCPCQHLVHCTKSKEFVQLSALFQANGNLLLPGIPLKSDSKGIFEKQFTSQNAQSTLSLLANLDADYACASGFAPSFVFFRTGNCEKSNTSTGFFKFNNQRYKYDRKNQSRNLE